MITMIVYVRRAKGMTREEFSRYLHKNHAPLVLGIPEFMRHVRKYIQYCLSFVGEERLIYVDPQMATA